jgi:DNA (cytosine-5)-methyltransferase 1
MENVPGLLHPSNRAVLSNALKIFADAGYQLSDDGPFILRADDFGVPQARRRVFLVGSRSDMALVARPSNLAGDKISVAQALNDLRYLERYRSLIAVDDVQLPPRALEKIEGAVSEYVSKLRVGADLDHGSLGFGYERIWDRALITSVGRTSHRADVVERFRMTPQGAEELISRLPRLRASGQSPTLRAGTGRDHGSFTSARPIHHLYPRVITVREAARLHSFPDWFRFHVTKWHGFQQIGNSVPPFLARAVAGSIIDALGTAPQKQTANPNPRNDHLLGLSLGDAAKHYDIDPDLLPKESRRARK